MMNVNDVMEKVKVHKRREVWKELLGKERSFPHIWINYSSFERYVGEIYSSHSSEEEKTRACSDTYVNSRPESSWEDLTSLLYTEDEMTAVDQARPFLPPRGM